MTAPIDCAGGVIDGGLGGRRYLPAAQWGHGPRSCLLREMSVQVIWVYGSLPVERFVQRLWSDG